jgi:hypothetical protein
MFLSGKMSFLFLLWPSIIVPSGMKTELCLPWRSIVDITQTVQIFPSLTSLLHKYVHHAQLIEFSR